MYATTCVVFFLFLSQNLAYEIFSVFACDSLNPALTPNPKLHQFLPRFHSRLTPMRRGSGHCKQTKPARWEDTPLPPSPSSCEDDFIYRRVGDDGYGGRSSAWAADGKVMRRLALLPRRLQRRRWRSRAGRWFILRLMSNEARCSDWLEATSLRRVYTQTTPQSNCTATKATSTSQTVISLIGTSTAFLCGSPPSPAADVFLLFCYSVRTMLKWNYYFAWVLWVR